MRRTNNIIYVAVAMIGLGGVLVFVAWDGAASVGGPLPGVDYTQGQIPFLISGGIGGLALIGVGLALVVVHSLRRDLTALGEKLDRVVDAIRENGGIAAGPSVVPSPDGEQVVAGRSTFHEADCHVVEGRSDLQIMDPETAVGHGLSPCRICEPPAPAPADDAEVEQVASA